jgi:4-carboxymuconolactone decarboxylase
MRFYGCTGITRSLVPIKNAYSTLQGVQHCSNKFINQKVHLPKSILQMNTDQFSASNTEERSTMIDLIPRYAGPSENEMTQQQIDIRDDIIRTRPRTGLRGPFGPWLAIPNIARPSHELGKACRYDTSLDMAESELIILMTAAKMRSHSEFDIHADEALKSGLSEELIRSIPRDDNFSVPNVIECMLPILERSRSHKQFQREKAIVLFTSELLSSCTVSEETYIKTKECLGGEDSVLVEITSIIGYYTYVAFTLNVFNIPST